MVKRDWELIRGFLLTMVGLVLLAKDVTTTVLTQKPWDLPAVVLHLVVLGLGVRSLWPKRKV